MRKSKITNSVNEYNMLLYNQNTPLKIGSKLWYQSVPGKSFWPTEGEVITKAQKTQLALPQLRQ